MEGVEEKDISSTSSWHHLPALEATQITACDWSLRLEGPLLYLEEATGHLERSQSKRLYLFVRDAKTKYCRLVDLNNNLFSHSPGE